MYIKSLFILVFTCLQFVSYAQINEKLQAKIEKRLSNKVFRHASTGVYVYDIESKSGIVSINGETSLVPASTLKLLTTLTALDRLHFDFEYQTEISYSGKIIDGVLDGNLYIEGSGDPTLGSKKLGTMSAPKLIKYIVKIVKEACIEEINGLVIADESIFDSFPISPSWQWNDIGNYYASGAWGININENIYRIGFSNRKKIGARPDLSSVSPKIPGLKLSNELMLDSAGTGDQAYVFGGPYNFDKRVVGTIPIGKGNYTIKGSIPNPPLFLAQAVVQQLDKDRIYNGGADTQFRASKEKRTVIGKISSPRFEKIVRQCNFESNNLYCESILKTMAYDKYRSGSGGYGIKMVKDRIRRLHLDGSSLNMEDGSGLSVRNHLSPKLLASFIGVTAYDIGIDTIKRFIPKVGVQGTVRGLSTKGATWAKSGSMTGILDYAGIIKTKSGKYVSFAIMVNQFDIKQKSMSWKLVNIMNDIYLNY